MKFEFLTDETVNGRLADALDPSLKNDASYQALVAAVGTSMDAVAALNLPIEQWRVVDEYADSTTNCLTVYATEAYRLGYKDGVSGFGLPVPGSSNVDAAEKILDALEDGTVPISWHALNRPKLVREIAAVLDGIAKSR